MSDKRQLVPATDLQLQARTRLTVNRNVLPPTQFRDALTRSAGAIRGIPTETTQWNRWSP
jgi:hypothetical protein